MIVFCSLATALDCISHSQIPYLHILLEMYGKYSDKQLYLLIIVNIYEQSLKFTAIMLRIVVLHAKEEVLV